MGDVVAFGNWAVDHAAEIVVVALAISGACAQFAALTPWKWDDEAAGFISRAAQVGRMLAGNYGHAANESKP